MLTHPTFKHHYRTQVVEGQGLFVVSEMEQVLLQGSLYEMVAPLLDGRPIDDVVEQLAERTKPGKVIYTIKRLHERGFVIDDPGLPDKSEAAWWSVQGVEPTDAVDRLAQVTVAVKGFGVDPQPLAEMLGSMSIRVADDAEFTVVLTDHYLRRELAEFNRQSLESGRAWMLVKPVGSQIWLGPVFRPGESACWECLAQRIRCNFQILGFLDSIHESPEWTVGDVARNAASLATAWGMTANLVSSWIVHNGDVPALDGKMQTYDLLDAKLESHTVLKQPACEACGEESKPVNGRLEPLRLIPRKKTYTEDGMHRSSTPQETIDKFRHHVSPISGAVSLLESSVPSDNGVMHVYFSGANVARGANNLGSLKSDLRESSCGKGINELQAKASALCEGLERYSGLFRGDEPWRPGKMADFGGAAIHPNECMLFSEKQYADRVARNAKPSVFNYIPERFDPEWEIDWTPVWSFTRNEARYLPTALCYFQYPQGGEDDYCVGCSNGNAAGNNLEEAVLQGFFELVERDGVGIWWYNRVQRPGIDLDSFHEPYLDQLRGFLKSKQRNLWVIDLSTDLGIPVMGAFSRRTEGATEQIMFGFGAHMDPRIALMRAVTELNQMLIPLLESDGDIPTEFQDPDTSEWLKNATVETQPYVLPSNEPPRTLASYPRNWTDDLLDDIAFCQQTVESHGLELLVLNQTRPEIGLPVVKVFVPGLRHFWARFAPGRLYDVPVKLGWRDTPCCEEDLNPNPMFL